MAQQVEEIIFERKPIKWLYDQLRTEHLFIDNTFQRKFVWTEKNQVQLIESILTGYPIPEIYVWERDTKPQTGETKYSVIDGQQRLTAIFNFLSDSFSLKTSLIENKDAEYKDKLFSELTDDSKSSFWKYPFAVRIVRVTVSREGIVEMFLRLNKTSLSLNPQELRNAEFQGKFLKLSQELSDNDFWIQYKIFNQHNVRRMLDIQFVSSILIFFRFGFDEEITQSSLNRAYDAFNSEYTNYESDRDLFLKIIEIATNLFQKFPESLSLFRRITHLYTLFTTLYYYLRKYKTFPDANLERYANFAIFYENETEFIEYFGKESSALFAEYKSLALEGTGKRQNRQRRFEIIRELTEIK